MIMIDNDNDYQCNLHPNQNSEMMTKLFLLFLELAISWLIFMAFKIVTFESQKQL